MKYVAILALGLAVASAVELNEETFEEAIAGKSAFVKFLAPW